MADKTKPMNIVFVDDHPVFTQSLATIFTPSAGYEVKTFNKPADFLNADFALWVPDIVIADISMPGINGIEMMDLFLESYSGLETRFIFLTTITDIHTVKRTLQTGARGFLSKDTSIEELKKAVAEVVAGNKYISSLIKEAMLNSVLEDHEPDFNLTLREKEVMNLLCRKQTPKEIAYKLHLAESTVRWYNKKIMQKFNVNRTSDLIVFAVQSGLYDPNRQ